MKPPRNHFKFLSFCLLILLAVVIGFTIKAYLGAIFLALVFAYILDSSFEYISIKTKRRRLSAILLIFLLFSVVLLPSIMLISSLYSQFQSFNLDLDAVEDLESSFENLTGFTFSIANSIDRLEQTIISNLRAYSQQVISFTTTFLIGLFLFIFTLYYSLLEKRTILNFVKTIIPFSIKNSQNLVYQTGLIIKALLIGQVLTAIIQGSLGMVAFLIAGIEGAIFWGFIMIILSLIPMVGSFLVWFPAGLFLLYQGDVGMGIFILAWGAIVVSQIDNLVRPVLVTRYYEIHPFFVILGVFAGLSVFGILGIIIGPLLLELFVLIYSMHKEEYMEKELS